MAEYLEARVANGAALWSQKSDFSDALSVMCDEAVQAGAFGVPTFATSSGLFFGNDRIDFLIEAMIT